MKAFTSTTIYAHGDGARLDSQAKVDPDGDIVLALEPSDDDEIALRERRSWGITATAQYRVYIGTLADVDRLIAELQRARAEKIAYHLASDAEERAAL